MSKDKDEKQVIDEERKQNREKEILVAGMRVVWKSSFVYMLSFSSCLNMRFNKLID